MPSILVVCYDTTTGRYLVQKAGSAQISDESITSAKLASGAVIGDRIAAAAITSSKIASGQVGMGHIYPGAITSAKIASGQVGMGHIYPGAITSAKIASGIVGTVHLRDLNVTSAKLTAALITSIEAAIADESVTSAKLASGAVIGDRIAFGAITSAKIASGQVGIPHIYHGAIISAKIASGRIGGVHLVDATITSAKIASGQIGGALIQNLGILSGKYAAESITEQALVSGISIDISELSQEPSFRAGELISAYQGIQFKISGYYGLAKIDDINTMPALGIAIANLVSGSLGTFQYLGRITNANWDFSGYVGDLLFLGSGQDTCEVTRIVPTASGECVQRIGKIAGEDTIFLKPELTYVQLAE